MRLESEACDCEISAIENLPFYYNHESDHIRYDKLMCIHRSDKFLYFIKYTSYSIIGGGLGKKPSTCIAKEIEIKYGF